MPRALATRLAVVSLLLIALAAGGCGSSKKHISKAEFLKRGNAICQRGNNEINTAGRRQFGRNKKPSRAQTLSFVEHTVIPSVQSQINQIRSLGAPSGDESRVRAIIDAAQAGLDKGKMDPALMATNGPGPFAKADQLARAYGLTVCGSG